METYVVLDTVILRRRFFAEMLLQILFTGRNCSCGELCMDDTERQFQAGDSAYYCQEGNQPRS